MDPRRQIPPMHRLLAAPALARLVRAYGREAVMRPLRSAVDRLRSEAGSAAAAGEDPSALAAELAPALEAALAERLAPPLRRVLNATGILVHTNLGRVPLPREVATALPPLLDASCDLEIDLATGRRGDRNHRASALLAELAGAQAAVVVNNNAAALMLALAAHLGEGRRQVVVSRGELVEIGGSFRIPEILAAVGAELVEVGTTNRTRLGDYAAALGAGTAVLLKVHPSNYRVAGFTAAVGAAALADLGRRHGVPVLVDEGSGLLRPRPEPVFAGHDSLAELIAAGCDLACGSGDKLLGGPQAGLLVGHREAIERCRRHPLYRALRPDRSTLAALDAVLRRHLAGERFPLDDLWPDPQAHRRRLHAAAAALGAEIVVADAYVGGGSAPERPIPGEALALKGDEDLLARLRHGDPPVVGYLREGRALLDLRTVAPEDDAALIRTVQAAKIVPEPSPSSPPRGG
ncbi:MAG TPA: L-seryl-tRNA(Sec) selenium transferase [Thermoanaerobaculia bacterium]|nr:L-seryl-tRNA(Sec) selenium transferase [Thermoanaerobaculia bacterium]